MPRMGWVLFLLLLPWLSTPARAETLQQVLRAPHRQRVYDYAGVLTAAARKDLRTQLLALEPKHLAQGAIIVVRRVEGHSIERFAQEVCNRWGIGEKRLNNGFLILVAVEQRKWRLQTGDGLRKKLPDAEAARLMRAAVVPAFREQRYADGLSAAVAAIRRRLSGERPVASAAVVNTPPLRPSAPVEVPPIGGVDLLVGFVCLILGVGAAVSLAVLLGPGSSMRSTGSLNSQDAAEAAVPDGLLDWLRPRDSSADHQSAAANRSSSDSNCINYGNSDYSSSDYGGGTTSDGGSSGTW